MKPRYLIDVDGVCAQFCEPLLSSIGGRLTIDDITDWNIFGFMTSEEKKVAYEQLTKKRFWLDQPPVPGAIEGIRQIRESGGEVLFVTTNWAGPYEPEYAHIGGCEEWETARRHWLKAYFDAHHDDVIVCSRKDVIVGEFFLDDRAENVVKWQRAHSRGIATVYDAPYNRHLEWPQRFQWGRGSL